MDELLDHIQAFQHCQASVGSTVGPFPQGSLVVGQEMMLTAYGDCGLCTAAT